MSSDGRKFGSRLCLDIEVESDLRSSSVCEEIEETTKEEEAMEETKYGKEASVTVPAEESECVVCMDSPCTHIFIPCGHKCVCGTCGELVFADMDKRCPTCRQVSTGVYKVY